MESKGYIRDGQEISLTRDQSVGDKHVKRPLRECSTALRRSDAALICLGLLSLFLSHNTICAEPGKNTAKASIVVVFAGHTRSLNWNKNHQGARSVSGIPEYKYNDIVACLFERRSGRSVQYKTIPSTLNIPFQSRPDLAEILGAVVFVEIHHDSVQPQIRSKLAEAVAPSQVLDYYRGFSIHVYPRPSSINLAKSIESCMLAAHVPYSQYHKEDVPGEHMVLVKGTEATYVRRNLYVLKHSTIPAVIVECGCIANPIEDELLRQPGYRQRMVEAICRGISTFLESTQGMTRREQRPLDTPCSQLDP